MLNPRRSRAGARNLHSQRAGGACRAITAWTAVALSLSSLAGCRWLPTAAQRESADRLDRVAKNEPSPESQETDGSSKVEVTAGGVLLGDASNLAFTEAEFREALQKVVVDRQLGSLDFLLSIYPDLAHQLLLAGPDSQLAGSALAVIGDAFDRVWQSPQQPVWRPHVDRLQNQPDGLEFVKRREKFLRLVSEEKLDDALALQLRVEARRLESIPARVEAARLEGSAYLIADRNEEAIEVLQEALQLAEPLPMQGSRLYLLLGEAYRHSQQREAWREAWIRGTTLESSISRSQLLCDPVFWTKAAYLRPSGQPWPDQVVLDFHSVLDQYGIEFPNQIVDESLREAFVWAVIGVQSLHRHESQNALLAFKKAEAMVSTPNLRSQLLLHQAVTMIDGGQAGPASPLLLRLASEKGIVADRARAVLGSLKLQHGGTAQGINLLQSALASVDQWPLEEQLRAKSDLALALLIQGNEAEGLALQEQMCQAFLSANLHSHAVQCLLNQAQYFQNTAQAGRQQATLERLAQIRGEPRGRSMQTASR